MARLDIQSLHQIRKLRQKQKEEAHEFREFYHALANVYHELKSNEDKDLLVSQYPKLSAQVYYYFNDSEIGGLIVRKYSFDKLGEYRLLAERVQNVLRSRALENNCLENVLQMNAIVPFRKEADIKEEI